MLDLCTIHITINAFFNLFPVVTQQSTAAKHKKSLGLPPTAIPTIIFALFLVNLMK